MNVNLKKEPARTSGPGSLPKVRSAFTLIELLVVIAIIAILAAILFPVFAQAKSAAKASVCIANIKNVTLGTIMYTDDYDGLGYPAQRFYTDPASICGDGLPRGSRY